MKHRARAALAAAALVTLRTCTCQDEPAEPLRPRARPSVPSAALDASAPDAAPPLPVEPDPVAARRCPPDMVDVAGEFCIDRYEAILIDHEGERPLSPFYHPTRARTRASYENVRTEPANPKSDTLMSDRARGRPGERPRVPAPPAFQLAERFEPRAINRGGVRPNGYSSGETAQLACENAGKRLCSEEEWVRACRGQDDRDFPYGDTYEPAVCNVMRENHPAALLHGDPSTGHRDPRLNLMEDASGPLLRPTGTLPRCASRWGDDAIYDMVGNLDEWIDDPSGVFLGGFFSRQTESGCASRIGAHPFDYFDYSLGVRCCA